MSKFARFAAGVNHGGYNAGPSVAFAAKLDAMMAEFKQWFVSLAGFGDYLRTFFAQYEAYFNEYASEHALAYTQLHKDFSAKLEGAIDQWLQAKGVTEDDFGEMLRLARQRGDAQSDEIIGVLLGLLDYELWIAHIFALKRSARLAAEIAAAPPQAQPQQLQVMTVAVPDGVTGGQQLQINTPCGQALVYVVPEGLGPGQAFSVSYAPRTA